MLCLTSGTTVPKNLNTQSDAIEKISGYPLRENTQYVRKQHTGTLRMLYAI